MYYILNQTNQIIAADKDFLTYCGVSHIDALFVQIANKETQITTVQNNTTIQTPSKEDSFSSRHEVLSSLLGDLTLVALTEEEIKEEAIQADETSFLLDDTSPVVSKEEVNAEPIDTETLEEASIDLDHDALFDTKASTEIETSDIIIDGETVSKTIGISHKDYETFFNEFIDTAISLEKDFQSTDTKKQKSATDVLSQLSDVLHLPMMGSIVQDIKSDNGKKKQAHVSSFYNTLSRLTLSNIEDTADTAKEEIEEKIELFDDPLDIVSEQESKPQSGKGFGTISLDDITPVPFSFKLEEAADDLSLPVELIKEFVDDFIVQAHSETKNMLEAYEAGDLDKIQKIGHLLKGASSNLRINPLSETLYQIQFCEDANDLEPLIHNYWAHFIAFEKQINLTSN